MCKTVQCAKQFVRQFMKTIYDLKDSRYVLIWNLPQLYRGVVINIVKLLNNCIRFNSYVKCSWDGSHVIVNITLLYINCRFINWSSCVCVHI